MTITDIIVGFFGIVFPCTILRLTRHCWSGYGEITLRGYRSDKF